MNNEILSLRQLEDDVFQAHCFIERSLPMLIHHQLCEGLNVIAGRNLAELMDWERRKTDEVYEHTKLCEGIKPDVKRFRRAVEKFTECAWKFKIGSAPFTYGEYQDYWAEITPRYYANYDKRQFHSLRHVSIEKKLKEEDERYDNNMKEYISHVLVSERESTKAFIH